MMKIKRIVQTGLFIALALVLRNTLSYMVYFGGAPGMRITFSGIFTKMPAILFGPLYGGIAGGILDILGYLMKPEGGYIVWMTFTAILSGVITGLLWKSIKGIGSRTLQKGFLVFFIAVGIIGIINHVSLIHFPSSGLAQALEKIGKSRDFATVGLELTALIGIGLLLVDWFIQKKNTNVVIHENYLKLLIAIGIAGVIETTLNTHILRLFIPALGQRGFIVFWIPRLIKEIFMVTIQAYIVAFLLSIYKKLRSE